MLWREAHLEDPDVEWQADLSWDEIAAMVGVEAPTLAPGEYPMDIDMATALYWPVVPHAYEERKQDQSHVDRCSNRTCPPRDLGRARGRRPAGSDPCARGAARIRPSDSSALDRQRLQDGALPHPRRLRASDQGERPMIVLAFLGDPKGLSHWFEVTAHVPNTLAQALVQAFVAVVVVGAVLRPLLKKVSAAWAEHKAMHERSVVAHERIAAALEVTAAAARAEPQVQMMAPIEVPSEMLERLITPADTLAVPQPKPEPKPDPGPGLDVGQIECPACLRTTRYAAGADVIAVHGGGVMRLECPGSGLSLEGAHYMATHRAS
jgi:hypothetical protein